MALYRLVFLTGVIFACAKLATSVNVLLMTADDAGFEFGTYRNKICQTPFIDQLAKKSLIFNNAYTSASSCSPSRSAILTGMPSHQNGMYGLHQGVHNFNSFNNVDSITKILKRNGIKTGIVGKKHVGPEEVYPFDYAQTEENNHINLIGRNITHMKLLVREFLNSTKKESKPFFLYVGFHDPHRCGHIEPELGEFCERFGSGGLIPDWKPWYYQWDEIQLPYHVQDTEPARRDIAAQYTAISRLDQGVGLMLLELYYAGYDNDTLVIFTSDNGIPFTSGRTNLYDPGVRVPMLMSSPLHKKRRYQVTQAMVSLTDIVPTVLDWFKITEADYDTESNSVRKSKLLGKSLLPIMNEEPKPNGDDEVYASQTHHEITMYYPMRAIRTRRYKLIHNINYKMPFPIDQDFYISPTFQDILNRTRSKQSIPWYKVLKDYYYRPQWELFDLKTDQLEVRNLAGKSSMEVITNQLQAKLQKWQWATNDPWVCAPGGVLEDAGEFINNAQCLSLDNDI